jgi:hypothetical protein
MALDQHPYAFRYEGRWWVSETPREEARNRLDAQRDWDRRNARAQRWWVSITIGATLGVALAFGLGMLVNLPPFVYLISLPVGFGVGAVVAALINKRIQGTDAAHATMPKRPSIPELTLIPRGVVRKATDDASAAELIRWSKQRYVGDETEGR